MQHYGVDVDYSPRLLSGNHLALQAGVAYDAGGRGLPNDTQAMVSLRYQWGLTPVAAVSALTPHVVLGADGSPADLMAWTHDPAVKMPQVLAIADQRVRRVRNVVVLALSQNGQWSLPSTALSESQAGSIHISTLRGALDANSVLEQLAKTTDSQGHALSDYMTLAVTSETAQSATLIANWLPAAQQLKGFDAFSLQVTEGDAESDSASATLTLSHNTEIPLANDTLKTVTVLPTDAIQVDYPAKTFTHVDSHTIYKICSVGATSSNQCQPTLDGLSISGDSDGNVHVKGASPNKTGTFLHSIIAVNEFGASQPSPNSGARVKIVVTQSIPIANDVNLNVKQSVTQPFSTPFPANTFSNVDAKTTYDVCKVGATSSSQCQATVDGLHASLNSDGSVKVSGNAPATVGTTVHSIIAVNAFGASQPSPSHGARHCQV